MRRRIVAAPPLAALLKKIPENKSKQLRTDSVSIAFIFGYFF